MARDTLKVLFVCTGNIFRSLSAEYCLKKLLNERGITNIKVSSAGTRAKKDILDPNVDETLRSYGISAKRHVQRKVNKKILEENDVVIAMSKDHQRFISKNFGYDVPLFNELAKNEHTPILDLQFAVPHPETKPKEARRYLKKTVRYIHDNVPKLIDYFNHYDFLFTDFVQQRRRHFNGYPFITLYESKHSLAFMSIDIPSKEDGHVLVIPKRRFVHLDDVPQNIQTDLIKTVSIVGRALMRTHQGYNVLLNNGRSAGQFIFHTHFHVIPRNVDDDIQIEVWKSKKVSRKRFVKLNMEIKKQIRKISK